MFHFIREAATLESCQNKIGSKNLRCWKRTRCEWNVCNVTSGCGCCYQLRHDTEDIIKLNKIHFYVDSEWANEFKHILYRITMHELAQRLKNETMALFNVCNTITMNRWIEKNVSFVFPFIFLLLLNGDILMLNASRKQKKNKTTTRATLSLPKRMPSFGQ